MSLTPEGFGDLPGAAADRTPGDKGDGKPVASPTVSVVVATRNRRHVLRRFVSAVAEDPAASEVIVVVDGDVDGSFEHLEALRAEFPRLHPILADPGGQMRALDIGVRHSSGDVVLLMDDDVIAGPGLVSAHARCHTGTHGLVVVGYMPVRLAEGSPSQTRLYASEYEEHCRRLESGELAVLEGLWLGNVSARRIDLRQVGVASPRFPVRWHADMDLGLRLRAAGAEGRFERSLVAAHLHAQSVASFLASAHERGKGTWYLMTSYAGLGADAVPAPVLDGLSRPAHAVVSLLGRRGTAGWSSRALMGLAAGAARARHVGLSVRIAQLARRIQVVSGFRAAARAGGRPGTAAAVESPAEREGAGPDGAPGSSAADYASLSTKSGK